MASKKTECVKVAVRCRPLMPQEIEDQREFIVETDSQRGEISIKNPKVDAGEPPKSFSFDSVYSHECTQEEVYLDTGYPIVECVLEGYNGTIFAYGQTGSGKTHTMTGKANELRGIIPRGFEQIFYGIELKPETQFLVRVSFLEIYNEEIYDLLAANPTNNKLQMRENSDTGCYVKDLQSLVVKSIDEMKEIQEAGQSNRHIGAHKLNRESSRSHSNFMITIETSETGTDGTTHYRVGKLNLVDLAGSERQSKTEATGDRLKEATNINKSLLTLGIVITALVDGASTHVPYRDSKLTRLLQESLGGNSKTVMIANCGPADWNYDETISTLRYASRAKNIKCKPKINEDPKDAMLRELQEEMAALRAQLEMGGGTAAPGMVSNGGMVMNAEPQIIEVEKIVEVRDTEKTAEMERKLEQEREEIKMEADRERAKIERQKNLAEDEKEKILKKLARKEEKKRKAKEKQQALIKKLKSMEEQMVRGNQMVEQATRQEQELQRAQAELEKRHLEEKRIAQQLKAKEDDWAGLEQKFSSQQEEIEEKSKKLKKLFQKYQAAGTEIIDLQHEFQREREDMVDTIRILTRQLQLKSEILEHFVPTEEAKRIEKRAQWNEDLDEWTMDRFDPATGATLTRPTSSVGLKRPTSEYARIARGLNDGNARFKQEDILSLDLDLPERTIEEYTGIINNKIQTTVQAVLNDIEDDMLFVPIDSQSERYYDPEADRQKRQAQRVQSARRPQTAPRKKAEAPAAAQKFPQARGLVPK